MKKLSPKELKIHNLEIAICDYINSMGGSGISFAELSRDVDGFRADDDANSYDLKSASNKNIIYWSDMSKEAVVAMIQLKTEGRVVFAPTIHLVYFCDGCTLKLPIVKQPRDYVKPHWLPVVLSTNPDYEKERQ